MNVWMMRKIMVGLLGDWYAIQKDFHMIMRRDKVLAASRYDSCVHQIIVDMISQTLSGAVSEKGPRLPIATAFQMRWNQYQCMNQELVGTLVCCAVEQIVLRTGGKMRVVQGDEASVRKAASREGCRAVRGDLDLYVALFSEDGRVVFSTLGKDGLAEDTAVSSFIVGTKDHLNGHSKDCRTIGSRRESLKRSPPTHTQRCRSRRRWHTLRRFAI